MKEIADKVDFIKIKNVYSIKDNIKQIKKKSTDQQIIFAK